jgi:hypothetical protein
MSLPVSSQSKHTGTFEIKTNLLNLIAAGPSLGLEYDLQNNFTIMFSAAKEELIMEILAVLPGTQLLLLN